jgi:L-iditol 2-dehydrogenase
VVEELGSDVRDVSVGDRVVVDQGRTCVSEGHQPLCEYCVTGDSHQCERYAEHGITGLPGGFAEFVTVPARNVVVIRSNLEPERAAMAEPLGCVVHSTETVMRAASRYRLDRRDGSHVQTILICGGGPAGLLFVQYLRNVVGYQGTLLVSEPNATKRALAERFDARGIDPSAGDVVQQVAELTNGRRAELLIEASGSGAVFAVVPGLIRKQATVLLYGHGHAGVDLSVMNQIQFLEPTLVSPVGASGGHDSEGRPVTYRRALDLLEKGTVDVAPLITHRYSSLDQVPAAFAGDHRQADYVKGVVLP